MSTSKLACVCGWVFVYLCDTYVPGIWLWIFYSFLRFTHTCAFAVAGPLAWNRLPLALRSTSTCERIWCHYRHSNRSFLLTYLDSPTCYVAVSDGRLRRFTLASGPRRSVNTCPLNCALEVLLLAFLSLRVHFKKELKSFLFGLSFW